MSAVIVLRPTVDAMSTRSVTFSQVGHGSDVKRALLGTPGRGGLAAKTGTSVIHLMQALARCVIL